jgi:hydrogenase nickel incorporation protein HypA/HybF
MHELSIATSIVETVTMEMQRRNLPRLEKIALRIGALSSVDPEALRFGFEAITAGTPLAKTRLEIEHVPVHGKCHTCGLDFLVEDFIFACPSCQSGQIEVTRGEELEIAYLEIAEREEQSA